MELREREVDVDALAAERRLHESDDGERRPVQIQLRSDFQRIPARIRRGDECLATALQVAPRGDLPGGHEPHVRVAQLDTADRVRLARDVGLRRVEHLLQRLPRRRDRGAEPLHPLGQAARECAAADCASAWGRSLPAAEAAAGIRAAALPRVRQGDAQFAETVSDLLLLGRRWRRDRPVDVDLVPTRLDLRDDLRNLPLLVHGLEGETGRDRGDALEAGDLLRLRLGEGQLCARQEEVVDEVRPGLAELGEVGDHSLVCLDDVAAAATAEGPAARIFLCRARQGQVGTDARERVERRALRLVETPREARDRDHEADADG